MNNSGLDLQKKKKKLVYIYLFNKWAKLKLKFRLDY